MTTAIPIDGRNQSNDYRRASLIGAAFVLGFATLLFGAAPAEARNDFANGFEDELGRIVAQTVASTIGHAIIAPAVVHREVRHQPYYAPKRYYAPQPYYGRYRHHGPRHYRPHHRRHHYRGHSHDRYCGHTEVTVIKKRYRSSDRYDHYERGDRYDDYDRRDRYDRREKRDRHRGRRGSYDY